MKKCVVLPKVRVKKCGVLLKVRVKKCIFVSERLINSLCNRDLDIKLVE